MTGEFISCSHHPISPHLEGLRIRPAPRLQVQAHCRRDESVSSDDKLFLLESPLLISGPARETGGCEQGLYRLEKEADNCPA